MEEARSSIIAKILSLLPLLLICTVGLGLVMFTVSNIVPPWQIYQTLQTDVEAGRQAADALIQSSNPEDAITVLEHRIESTEADLLANTSVFMSQEQADFMLPTLYGYAKASAVEIVSLQTQQATDASAAAGNAQNSRGNNNTQPEPVADPYSIRAFRLQVDGGMGNLLQFVTRIRESSMPGVVIKNLAIRGNTDTISLYMDVLIYTSPLSTGEAYVDLPSVILPLPVSTPLEVQDTQTLVIADATAEPGSSDAPTDAGEGESVGSMTMVANDAVEPEPPLTLLTSENFDSGNLDNWKLGAGWILYGEAGAQTLQVTDSNSDVTFAYDTLMNAAVQMRVLLSSSSVRLSLPQSTAGWYSVILQPTGQVALYRGTELVKTTTSETSSIGRWRVVRLSVIDGIIRVSIDGVTLLTSRDSSELPPGTFSFSMIGRGVMRVDDVEIWQLEGATP
ncbi:MAG: hypothetical protein JNJ78_02630 [Anaerolineae bacterium]|nr:hypothetical protein [Anaerolineae bacterium]